jgi:hypothetical protein
LAVATNVTLDANDKVQPFAAGLDEGDFMALSGFGEVLGVSNVINDLPASHDFLVSGQDGWFRAEFPTSADTDAGSIATVVIDAQGEGVDTDFPVVNGKIYKLTFDFTITGNAPTETLSVWHNGFDFIPIYAIGGTLVNNRYGSSSRPAVELDTDGAITIYFLAWDTLTSFLTFDAEVVTDGFTFTIDNPVINEVFPVDGNIYELGAFTDNTAPLSSYLGDLDLSGLAAPTGAGLGSLATLDDWAAGDGVGPYQEVSNAELITNGDMELDSNWINSSTPTTQERSAEQAHSLTYSRKFVGNSSNDGIKQVAIPVSTIGSLYLMTAWIYGDGTNKLQIRYIDSGNQFYSDNQGDIFPVGWTHISFVVMGAGAVPNVSFGLGASDTTGTFYIDDVSIKKITARSAQVTGSQSAETSLLQDLSEAAGKRFNVAWDMSERSAGGVKPSSGGADGVEQTVDGSYFEILKCLNTDNSGLKPSVAYVGLLDNIVFLSAPVPGDTGLVELKAVELEAVELTPVELVPVMDI